MWRTTIASALFAVTLCVPAFADQWNKKTKLTVHETINVSGTVLQPGEYVMKLLDSSSNRHIVQIFNAREDRVYTTILAIPNYRLRPTEKTAFVWWEVPAGQPRAMRAWFYPGDNFGQEFVYPKGMGRELAAVAAEPVPVMETVRTEELATAPVKAVEKTGEEEELVAEVYTPPATPRAALEPEPAPVPAVPEPAFAEPIEELPATASPFVAIGLAGLASAFAGLTLRRKLSRRS
jgi:hypothetical protein